MQRQRKRHTPEVHREATIEAQTVNDGKGNNRVNDGKGNNRVTKETYIH
jgi:hypothetical protein